MKARRAAAQPRKLSDAELDAHEADLVERDAIALAWACLPFERREKYRERAKAQRAALVDLARVHEASR